MKNDFIELVLTCGSWQEAQKIADVLLQKHLVACVEMLEIKSKYHWQGKIDEANEVKLVMETVDGNFDKVETEVKKLHSYDTFVLQQRQISQINEDAAKWLQAETKQDN